MLGLDLIPAEIMKLVLFRVTFMRFISEYRIQNFISEEGRFENE